MIVYTFSGVDHVPILPGTIRLDLWPFLRREEAVEIPPYWIDQYEVTNEQFKKFVDNDGYEKQEWWKHQFVKNERELSWEQAIVLFGGLPPFKLAPTADPINFAPRVKAPVLIISGELDFIFPIETTARPLLEFLDSTDKELKTYEGGHGSSMLQFSRQIRSDVLGWLDRYLGSVD